MARQRQKRFEWTKVGGFRTLAECFCLRATSFSEVIAAEGPPLRPAAWWSKRTSGRVWELLQAIKKKKKKKDFPQTWERAFGVNGQPDPSAPTTIATSTPPPICFPSISYPLLVLLTLRWRLCLFDWTGAANFLLFLAGWMLKAIALLKQGQRRGLQSRGASEKEWGRDGGTERGAPMSQRPPWPN